MDRREYIILGAGESGVGAAILAKKYSFPVFVSDRGTIQDKYKKELEAYQIPYEEGTHSEERILAAREVIKSPGIPDSTPLIHRLEELQVPIISEIEFAYRYAQESVMIAITGSNGKTTSTNWLYHILTKANLDVAMAGNVGISLARLVALDPHQYYVIELSSFQLDRMYQFHAHVAVLLNITPDHLDRYNYQMALYAQSKLRIRQQQTDQDFFISWAEDPWIQQMIAAHPQQPGKHITFSTHAPKGIDYSHTNLRIGCYIDDTYLHLCSKEDNPLLPLSDLALPGLHNAQNAMAVTLAAHAVGVPESIIIESLRDFVNVPHRLEFVAEIDGVRYINDSKATNINSTWYALESMTTPTVLIIGGTDKGNNYEEIMDLVQRKVIAMIYLASDTDKLHAAFDLEVPRHVEAKSMNEAISLASQMAQEGETVLLSPACASFDLFDNYEDRGDQFRSLVLELQKEKSANKDNLTFIS